MLYSGVACIVDLIIKEGLINLDFADVRTVHERHGLGRDGHGRGFRRPARTLAAEEAISNPLIDDVSLKARSGLCFRSRAAANLTLYEVDEAASRVRREVDPEANIIVGATFDETLGDRVRVSIVASGWHAPANRSGAARISGGPGRAARSMRPRFRAHLNKLITHRRLRRQAAVRPRPNSASEHARPPHKIAQTRRRTCSAAWSRLCRAPSSAELIACAQYAPFRDARRAKRPGQEPQILAAPGQR